MTDEKRRPDTARPPTRDMRRTTSRDEVVESRGMVIAERTAEREIRVSARELDIFRAQIRSEVNQQIDDLSRAVEHRINVAVRTAMAPHEAQLEKLDTILARLEDDRREREEYRVRREERESVEAEERVRQSHDLAMLKVRTEVQMLPVESSRKYRTALFATFGTIIIALAGLVGAAIASHGGR